ncbi:hypothetical protein AXG93_1660s1600 [Marchantia polymorpha subsp. ruderalis]|nr:hypothetical protein AXG93_1660s1600 [Marchantia polymorpha subsp. ruderalis]
MMRRRSKRRINQNEWHQNSERNGPSASATEFRCEQADSELKILQREVWSEASPLDAVVWSRGLPDDVYCTILAHLPLSSFLRLRTVCKSWNSMTKDKSFLEACSRISSQNPSLLLMDNDNCWTYEPAVNDWKSIPLSFFKPHDDSHGPAYVVSSAGGKILLLRRCRLLLYNPLNDSLKLLPPMLDMEPRELPAVFDIHIIGMFVTEDGTSDAINILVMNKRTNEEGIEGDFVDYDSFEPFVSQVYDSRTESWKMKVDFKPLFKWSISSAAMSNTKLLCVTTCKRNPQPSHLAIYSVVSDTADAWRRENIAMPHERLPLVSPHLFTHRGTLMLVAALPTYESRNERFPVWNNVIIWKLSRYSTPVETDGHWERLMEFEPKDLNDELWNTTTESFFFLTGGDYIYFGSRSGSSVGMINLRSHTWRLLPSFPGITSHFGNSILNMNLQTFLFQPRFDLVL